MSGSVRNRNSSTSSMRSKCSQSLLVESNRMPLMRSLTRTIWSAVRWFYSRWSCIWLCTVRSFTICTTSHPSTVMKTSAGAHSFRSLLRATFTLNFLIERIAMMDSGDPMVFSRCSSLQNDSRSAIVVGSRWRALLTISLCYGFTRLFHWYAKAGSWSSSTVCQYCRRSSS